MDRDGLTKKWANRRRQMPQIKDGQRDGQGMKDGHTDREINKDLNEKG